MKPLWLCVLLLTSCYGDPNTAGKSNLNASFTANGFALNMQQTSLNTYKFTVVQNTVYNNSVVFTVYGLQSDSQIPGMNTATHARLGPIVNGTAVNGAPIEVTFNNDDNWFVIYQNDWDGSQWIDSTKVEMIRGKFR